MLERVVSLARERLPASEPIEEHAVLRVKLEAPLQLGDRSLVVSRLAE
jgi:hypothetical protein